MIRVDAKCIDELLLFQLSISFEHKIQKIVLNQFDHATVNVYCENTTIIKPDPKLKEWFLDEYKWLDDVKHLEVLWNNTDFGVGD